MEEGNIRIIRISKEFSKCYLLTDILYYTRLLLTRIIKLIVYDLAVACSSLKTSLNLLFIGNVTVYPSLTTRLHA